MRRIGHVLGLIGAYLVSGCEIGPIVDIGRSLEDAGPRLNADADVSTDAGSRAPGSDAGTFVRPLPDLLVEEIGPVPTAIAPDDVLFVSLTIHNRGRRSSKETIAPIRLVPVDGPAGFEIGLIHVPPLVPDERLERTRVLPIPPVLRAGVYRVVVEVDPDDRVEELVETNNRLASPPIAYSDLALVPSSLDFGVVGTGCEVRVEARLENRGPARRIVSRAELGANTHPSFSVLGPVGPIGINANQALEFTFVYAPQMVGAAAGSFVLQHSQLIGETAYPLRGASAVNPQREETHKQVSAPQIDILFVIDNSQSMQQEQEELARGAADFFRFIESRQVDYNIAVTTTDVSALGERGLFVGNPSIIRGYTPNAAAAFERNVRVGTSGASAEQGFEAARLALSSPAIDGPNKGFLRPEASLAVIFVSDEDDGSPQTVDEHAAFFETLRSPEGDARFVANAIVGPPEGCATAAAGTRYTEMAQRTAGVTESICTFNWSNALRNFPGDGFGYRHAFTLQRDPTAGSMKVFVNGVELPRLDPTGQRANWYLIEGPTLVFDAIAVPEPGSTIVVRYETDC